MIRARWTLDLESISSKATMKLLELDRSLIGTPEYMGLAYFWAYEYRHFLRDCTVKSRKKVHDKILEAGLPVDSESPEVEAIVKRYVKGYIR